MLMASALGLAGYRGIQGTNSSQIAALTTGTASIYAINQLLVNDKISAVYAAGIESISCVEKTYSGMNLLEQNNLLGDPIKTQLKDKVNALNALRKQYRTITAPACLAEKQNRLSNIEEHINALVLTTIPFQTASTNMLFALNSVDAKVKKEVDSILPDIEGILAISSSVKPTQESLSAIAPTLSNYAAKAKGSCTALTTTSSPAEFNQLLEEVGDLLTIIKAYRSALTLPSPDQSCSLNVSHDMIIADGKTKEFSVAKAGVLVIPIFNGSEQITATPSDSNMTVVIEYNASSNSKNIKITPLQLTSGQSYTLTVQDHKHGYPKTIKIKVL